MIILFIILLNALYNINGLQKSDLFEHTSNTINEKIYNDEGELIFTFQMFRHGYRTPIFNSDMKGKQSNYIDYFGIQWNSESSLTEKGKEQIKNLGIFSRKRYDTLAKTILTSKEFEIYTTNFSRTNDSAIFYLNGFFNEIYNRSNIKIIPFSEYAQILALDEFCPYAKTVKIFSRENSKEFKDIYAEIYNKYVDGLRHIQNVVDVDYYRNYFNLHKLSDCYLSDFTCNKNLSHMIKYGINPEEFYNFSLKIHKAVLFEGKMTKELSYYAVSKTMNKLLVYFDNAIKNKENKIKNYLKFVIYSSHDVFMVPFEIFINDIYNDKIGTPFPDFGSFISFELYMNKSNDNKITFYVKYTFNGITLALEDYSHFKERLTKLLLNKEEIEEYCQKGIMKKIKENGYNFLYHIYSLIIIFTLLFFVYFFFIRFRISRFDYKSKENKKEKLNEQFLKDKDIELNEL